MKEIILTKNDDLSAALAVSPILAVLRNAKALGDPRTAFLRQVTDVVLAFVSDPTVELARELMRIYGRLVEAGMLDEVVLPGIAHLLALWEDEDEGDAT